MRPVEDMGPVETMKSEKVEEQKYVSFCKQFEIE